MLEITGTVSEFDGHKNQLRELGKYQRTAYTSESKPCGREDAEAGEHPVAAGLRGRGRGGGPGGQAGEGARRPAVGGDGAVRSPRAADRRALLRRPLPLLPRPLPVWYARRVCMQCMQQTSLYSCAVDSEICIFAAFFCLQICRALEGRPGAGSPSCSDATRTKEGDDREKQSSRTEQVICQKDVNVFCFLSPSQLCQTVSCTDLAAAIIKRTHNAIVMR